MEFKPLVVCCHLAKHKKLIPPDNIQSQVGDNIVQLCEECIWKGRQEGYYPNQGNDLDLDLPWRTGTSP